MVRAAALQLPPDLLEELERVAAASGRSVASIVEETLRQALDRPARKTSPQRPALVTFAGDGLRPGVDLDRSAALLDLMESAPGGPH